VKETRKLFHVTGDSVGWGWIRTDKFVKRVTRIGMGSSTEALYVGLIDVLQYVGRGSNLLIKIDSRSVLEQLDGKRIYETPWAPRWAPRWRELRKEVRKLIRERELEVELQYVTPYHHFASKLLRIPKNPWD